MLTTLSSVKQWLGLTTNASDTVLTSLISSCSEEIEMYLNRTIESTAYTELRDGNNSDVFMLKAYPVQAVIKLVVDGISYKEIPIDDFTSKGVKLDDRKIIAQGFIFPRGRRTVYIQYLAGYDEIPKAIEQACNELIAARFKNERGDRQGVSSKSLAGETISFSHSAMPNSVKSALSDFINVVPI